MNEAPTMLDDTHDPALRSWVDSANDGATDFPVQNLPFGRFRRAGTEEPYRIGVAIGDQVLDLKMALEQCPWDNFHYRMLEPLAAGNLYHLMSLGPKARHEARAALSNALRHNSVQGPFLELCLVPQARAEMTLPCRINDYTDFYTGIHHAQTVGKLFRPDAPLLPNYKWVPIGYHGRASSIIVSGKGFARPSGQMKGTDGTPVFGACRALDYELELGALIGPANAMGEPVGIEQAEDRLFGMVLLNDWSARDLQAWEYQPLGPFLGKSFATTISPWVVTMDALAPFRKRADRPEGDPQPLPYLDSTENREQGAIDITLEVWLQTPQMKFQGLPAVRLMQSSFLDAYWTLAQLVAHHTSNGCNLSSGDLLGTGTLSGPTPGQGGSLLELTQGGRQPITLPGGEQRTFLLDGDTVTLRGRCARAGFASLGFGECVGQVGA
ncbi:MAG: fumarylacetoacetase [Methylibium sp. NZG]|nr:MAG: fumarylacetoacetase [Methylibium sp. NZG]